jgi:hypothetical protein
MTLLIAMHHGTLVTLAGDQRRVVKSREAYVPISDSEFKILHVGGGILAGSGLCQLLDLVAARLQAESVTHTDQVLQVIRECREEFLEDMPFGAQTMDGVNESGWFYAYCTLRDDQPTSRLLIYHPSLGDAFFNVLPGTARMIAPGDIDRSLALKLDELLNRAVHECVDPADEMGILQLHLPVLIETFDLVSEVSAAVSKSFNLGVYSSRHGLAISHPITRDTKHVDFY